MLLDIRYEISGGGNKVVRENGKESGWGRRGRGGDSGGGRGGRER